MGEAPARPTIGINDARDVTGYSVRHIKRLIDDGRLIGARPDWPGAHRRVDEEDAHLLGRQRNPTLTRVERDAIKEQRRQLRIALGLPADVPLDGRGGGLSAP